MAQNGNETQCSVLSVADSRNSLAGKKKKKMVFKSMLMPPLPIPLDRLQSGTDNLDTILTRELATISNTKSSREWLALGANAVSKQLGKNNLAALILAADIKPPSLIAHVITKAIAGNVPLLKINNLREITKQSLGFECIAVGFKKDSNIFNASISTILSEYVNKQEPTNADLLDSLPLQRTIPFAFEKRIYTYEIRDASKPGRSFIPELHNTKNESSTVNFITIDDGHEFEAMDCSELKGISSNILKNNDSPKKKKKKTAFLPAKTIKVQTNKKRAR